MSDFKKNKLPTPGERFLQKIYGFVNYEKIIAKRKEKHQEVEPIEDYMRVVLDAISYYFNGQDIEEIKDTFRDLLSDAPIIFHSDSEIAEALNAEYGRDRFSKDDIRGAKVFNVKDDEEIIVTKVYALQDGRTLILIYDRGKENQIQIESKDF